MNDRTLSVGKLLVRESDVVSVQERKRGEFVVQLRGGHFLVLAGEEAELLLGALAEGAVRLGKSSAPAGVEVGA